ncbi:MAG TPA: tetratricopeptide repeat protein [Pyrinomonadaceae bacterium]
MRLTRGATSGDYSTDGGETMMADSQNQNKSVADVPPELAARLVHGEINLAEFVGLTRETLYEIAQVGYQFFTSGRVEQARQIYRGLVAADPFDSVFHCHLAAAHHRLGELDAAEQEYTKALRFNIANADALAGRGEIFLQNGRIAEAIADLQKAIELDPAGERATTLRARAVLLAMKNAAQQQQKQPAPTQTDAGGNV